jgi:predicted permease
MSTLLQDLQFSLRTLRKSPGFALTAILTLALGIGAVTSVFSVVNAVLLKPFGFQEPDRLVVLRETAPQIGNTEFPANYQHYLNWKINSKTLADATIFENQTSSVSSGNGENDHPQLVGGLHVSPNFFAVLGVTPVLGRSFLPADAEKHNDVVILSWSAWQKYFQGSPSALGKTLRIGGDQQTVVGVLPKSFNFPHMDEMATAVAQREIRPYEMFQPLYPDKSRFTSNDGDYDFLVVGRLKPGVSLAQVESELGGLQQAFFRAAHLPYHPWIVVRQLKQDVTRSASTSLWLLLAAVGAVLLIACVNLANLQIARAVSRERDLAVRAALGADRQRLARTVLMDSLVLALVGGALGVLLSFSGVRLLIAAAPASLPRLDQAHVSLPVLAVASALSMFTALMFGMLPALRATRVHPQAAMKTNPGRVANTREGQRTRHLLVAGEVAFTVVLLIVTGLLVRSFSRLLTQQRDFDADHVSLAEVHLFNPQYSDSKQGDVLKASFIDRALTDLEKLPGVKRAAMTSAMPLAGENWIDGIHRPDHPLPRDQEPAANMRWVSPSYASTLSIPLLRGRDLDAEDRSHPTNVLISEQTARTAWPGEDPVGKTFYATPDEQYSVVGVLADARVNDLKSTANMIYVPYWDNPRWSLYFLVRSNQPTSALADSIRRTLWKIDPNIPIPVVKSLAEQVSDSVAIERFQTIVLSTFGIAALLLALLGVYGVLAYSVSLRQQEFGIRIALGSGRGQLIGLVVRQASRPVVGGIIAGLLLALGAVRAVKSLLYETSTADPFVIGASIVLLLSAALLAAWLPARRAATTDPMRALRTE